MQLGKDILAASRESYNGEVRSFGNAAKEGIINSKSDIIKALNILPDMPLGGK